METIRLACQAMATRFELVLHGRDPVHLRSAAEEGIREIKRIASCFSFFNPMSELSGLNRKAGLGPVRVSGELFELLLLCRNVYRESAGLFDPTIAALMTVWGFHSESASRPSSSLILEALKATGFEGVRLNESTHCVQYSSDQLRLDLGGVAKGWALDECRRILIDLGIEHALLHGGTSSIHTIGTDVSGNPWRIGIQDPYLLNVAAQPNRPATPAEYATPAEHAAPTEPTSFAVPPSQLVPDEAAARGWFTTSHLAGGALSVSAIHGRSFKDGGIEYGHVLNPKTGEAVSGPIVSAVEAPSAALADAWSTALIVSEREIPITGTTRQASFEKSDHSWNVRSGNWNLDTP